MYLHYSVNLIKLAVGINMQLTVFDKYSTGGQDRTKI